jgi:hypothetical protein
MVTKKKIDNRIRIVMENGIRNNHRTFFVIVGDKGKDQVKFQNFSCLFFCLSFVHFAVSKKELNKVHTLPYFMFRLGSEFALLII